MPQIERYSTNTPHYTCYLCKDAKNTWCLAWGCTSCGNDVGDHRVHIPFEEAIAMKGQLDLKHGHPH